MNHSFNSHRIRCISIIGGFLDGTKFELADGLNCFIGARGAGKTTMLEFVRYALDALPSREEQPIERRRIESRIEHITSQLAAYASSKPSAWPERSSSSVRAKLGPTSW